MTTIFQRFKKFVKDVFKTFLRNFFKVFKLSRVRDFEFYKSLHPKYRFYDFNIENVR